MACIRLDDIAAGPAARDAATRRSHGARSAGVGRVSAPAVVVHGVHKTFPVGSGFKKRRLQALRGVDLALNEGEAVALVGESGCGKSTLLRSIAGLQPIDEGTIEFGKGARPQMVFQDAGASLTPWLTVGEQIEERLRSEPIGRQERKSKVIEALAMVGLPPEVATAKPVQLSGGQRQRVGLARATVVPPEVLLCDEPTSALDVSLAATVLNLIGRLRRELGVAILFVTHDLAAARMVGDRIAVMYLGRIVEIGDADELCADPVHPYTRALLDTVPEVGRVHVRLKGEPANPLEPPDRVSPSTPAARWPRPVCIDRRCGARAGDRVSPRRRAACPVALRARAPPARPWPRDRRSTMAVAEAFVPTTPRRGTARLGGASRALGRTTLADKVGFGLLAVLVLAAIFAPLLAPYNPITPSGLPFTPPLTGGHLMGTDEIGFDIFSRVLYGLRTSLIGAVVVVTSGVVIGGTIGLVAGVVGGWVDTLLMRITDLFLALPGPVLAIAFVAALGPSEFHTLLAVAIVWWPFYARIMRGEIRALAARPHLEAARLAGAGPVPPRLPPPAARCRARHRGDGQPRRRATWCSPWPACPSSASGPRPPPPSSAPWPPAACSSSSRSGGCRSCPALAGLPAAPWRPTSPATASTT